MYRFCEFGCHWQPLRPVASLWVPAYSEPSLPTAAAATDDSQWVAAPGHRAATQCSATRGWRLRCLFCVVAFGSDRNYIYCGLKRHAPVPFLSVASGAATTRQPAALAVRPSFW